MAIQEIPEFNPLTQWHGTADDDKMRRAYATQCVGCGACCSYYAHEKHGLPADGWYGEFAPISPALAPLVVRHRLTILDTFSANERLLYRVFDPIWFKSVWRKPYGHRYFFKTVKRHGWSVCAAFRGLPGQKGSGCAVYADRPAVCSKYEPGGRGCLKCRRWARLPDLTPFQIAEITGEHYGEYGQKESTAIPRPRRVDRGC
jgi:Fe-S-cluster containining protein